MTSFGIFAGAVVFVIVGSLVGRQVVLWYFRFNRMVELLESIERNTRQSGISKPSTNAISGPEVVIFEDDKVFISNNRTTINGESWPTKQLQSVRVDKAWGGYEMKIRDVDGKELHAVTSDNYGRLELVARAINKALIT